MFIVIVQYLCVQSALNSRVCLVARIICFPFAYLSQWVWLSICRQKIIICMLISYLHPLLLHRSDASTQYVWLLALAVLILVHIVWLHTLAMIKELTAKHSTQYYTRVPRRRRWTVVLAPRPTRRAPVWLAYIRATKCASNTSQLCFRLQRML